MFIIYVMHIKKLLIELDTLTAPEFDMVLEKMQGLAEHTALSCMDNFQQHNKSVWHNVAHGICKTRHWLSQRTQD